MTVIVIPRTTPKKRKSALPKKAALQEIVSLIDEYAPTDDDGQPIKRLTPQEYDELLNDIYTLAADALGTLE